MSAHLHDDDLARHFYGDGSPDEEAAADAHLAACPACHRQWTELREALAVVNASAVPEPDADFEPRIWARVRQTLAESQPAAHPAWLPDWLSGPFGAATAILAASVVVLIGLIVMHLGHVSPPAGPEHAKVAATSSEAASARERVLLTALDDHFERSEMLLVEVMNAPDRTPVELGFERRTADDLVDSSRLYRATALRDNDRQLAQMLEDLESVLVEIARSPDHMNAASLKSLRARIDDNDLLFKVRVVANEIEHRQQRLLTE